MSPQSTDKPERFYDTPEAREFWDSIRRDADMVSTWPEWRKAGITTDAQEEESQVNDITEPRPQAGTTEPVDDFVTRLGNHLEVCQRLGMHRAHELMVEVADLRALLDAYAKADEGRKSWWRHNEVLCSEVDRLVRRASKWRALAKARRKQVSDMKAKQAADAETIRQHSP